MVRGTDTEAGARSGSQGGAERKQKESKTYAFRNDLALLAEYITRDFLPGLPSRLFSPFLLIFSFISGFVFVSGNTVMAAQHYARPPRKAKAENNIKPNQLTSGHFPGTPRNAFVPLLKPYRSPHRLFSLLIICAGSFLPACQRDEPLDVISGPVMFELREAITDQKRVFRLKAETIEDYPCSNFDIVFELRHTHGLRDLWLKGLRVPSVCVTNFAPARADILLGYMEHGEHAMRFRMNESMVNADFRISQSLLEVSTSAALSGDIGFREMEMIRLGEDVIWGYIMPLSEPAANDPQVFLQQLNDMGAAGMVLPDGNYGFFRIRQGETELFVLENRVLINNPQVFVMTYEGDFALLRQAANQLRHLFQIELFSGRAEAHGNQD